MMTNMASIQGALGLLKDLGCEDELDPLRVEFPNLAHLLEPGTTLGGEEDWLDEAKLMLAVQKRALAKSCQVVGRIQPTIEKRIRASRRLRLVAAVFASIGGAGVLVALGNDWKPMSYVTGGLSALGGLVGIILEQQMSGLGGQSKGLVGCYEDMIDYMVRADRLGRQFEVLIEKARIERKPDIEAALKEAEVICDAMRKLALTLGVLG